jgi:hypothetical protein
MVHYEKLFPAHLLEELGERQNQIRITFRDYFNELENERQNPCNSMQLWGKIAEAVCVAIVPRIW